MRTVFALPHGQTVAVTVLMGLAGMLCCDLAAASERRGEVEELAEQVRAQQQRIDRLESELGKQREAIRRLPGVADVADGAKEGAAPASAAENEGTTTDQEPVAKSEQDAQNLALRERIERLEAALPGVQEQQRSFLESPSTESLRVVNGRIHIDQWSFPQDSPGVNSMETGNPADGPVDRLLYRRIRFGANGKVPPGNMSYKIEIEFSGQDGSQFRDAWIGWDDLVWFNTIRFGNQKRPYGLDHLNSSNFNVFLERPFIVDAFNEDNRRFGLVSYGVSDDLRFNWRYGVYDLSLIQDIGSTLNDNYPLEFAWRVANTFWYDDISDGRGYGHLGLSGTFAFPEPEPAGGGSSENRARFRTRPEGRSSSRWLDTGFLDGANAYQLLGVESVVNLGRFQVAGEYMNVWMQRFNDYGSDLHFHGGYVYLSYFLTGEHIPWKRDLGILGRVEPFEDFFHVNACNGCIEHGLGAWEVAVRFSHADLSDENVFGGIGDSVTLALNWYWNAHARLSLNYIYGQIDDRLATLSSGGSEMVSGSYEIFGLRSIIDF